MAAFERLSHFMGTEDHSPLTIRHCPDFQARYQYSNRHTYEK